MGARIFLFNLSKHVRQYDAVSTVRNTESSAHMKWNSSRSVCELSEYVKPAACHNTFNSYVSHYLKVFPRKLISYLVTGTLCRRDEVLTIFFCRESALTTCNISNWSCSLFSRFFQPYQRMTSAIILLLPFFFVHNLKKYSIRQNNVIWLYRSRKDHLFSSRTCHTAKIKFNRVNSFSSRSLGNAD